MAKTLSLSQEERTILQQILRTQSQRSMYPMAFDKLIHDWARFVTTVERGYVQSIYEYTNDLSTRDLIQEILDKVPSKLRLKLLASIEPWDQRFFASTKPVDKPVRLNRKGKAAPWHVRVPMNPGLELEKDLRSEGLL